MFVFGGRSKEKIHGDTWYYDFASKNWTEAANVTEAPEPRFTMAFGVVNDEMVISTGEGPDKVFYNDVWRLVPVYIISLSSTSQSLLSEFTLKNLLKSVEVLMMALQTSCKDFVLSQIISMEERKHNRF